MSTTFKIAHKLDLKWRSADVALGDTLFENLMLKDEILKGLAKCGFVKPSPIQLEAIPLGRCGLDLVIQSKSGTGKTCVYSIIALESLSEANFIQILILCPTREIAFQVQEVINSIGCFVKKLRCKLVTGGYKLEKEKSLKGCNIVVGTPGRVKHLIKLGLIRTDTIRMLILDEADKLLDVELKNQIDSIFSSLSESKQLIAVSATFPTELAHLIEKYMRSPCFVRLDKNNPSLVGITQYYCKLLFPNPEKLKLDLLFKILSKVSFSQCLIFRNTFKSVESLFLKLKEDNWPVDCFSGYLSHNERCKSIESFKALQSRIMVTTDLFARGIDCENVNLVINMDMPKDPQTYFHRIGRAGRFGSRGIAITLVGKDSDWTFFKQMLDQFVVKAEILPDLDDIYNLWNMFDPSLSDKDTNFDSSQFLKRLKEKELESDPVIDKLINFKNKFELNEYHHQIKIKLGSNPNLYLVESR